MGNQNSISYSLDKFIQEICNVDIYTLNETELKKKLSDLCLVFNDNPLTYSNFKTQELSTQSGGKKQVFSTMDPDGEEREDDEEITEEISKTKKFCRTISKLIGVPFSKEIGPSIYMSLVKIMLYLGNNKFF